MRDLVRTGASAAIGLLTLFVAATAQAALVNFSLTGYVDGSDGAYGLNVGDAITASGVFDDSAISVAPYTVYFDQAHSGNTMTVVAGSLTLDNTQDDFYALGGSPKLEFDSGGALIGLGFDTLLLDGGSFYSGTLGGFLIEDGDLNLATGYWDPTSFTMTPVPLPAAVWLLSSGLLGLAGLARRTRRAA